MPHCIAYLVAEYAFRCCVGGIGGVVDCGRGIPTPLPAGVQFRCQEGDPLAGTKKKDRYEVQLCLTQ